MDEVPSFDLSGQGGAGHRRRRAASAGRSRWRWPAPGRTWRWGCATPAADGGLAAEIAAMGRRALPLQMDVTDLGQARAAIDRAAAELGRHRHPGQQCRRRHRRDGARRHRGGFRRGGRRSNVKSTFFLVAACGAAR